MLQNNQWAISTPRSIQTAGADFASRAPAYGFPGVSVDGNDLFAVHAVAADAVARGRAGKGATLIEAHTYRMGMHTTADDPTRYVDPGELERWGRKDPIERVQKYLAGTGSWDEATRGSMGRGDRRAGGKRVRQRRRAPGPRPGGDLRARVRRADSGPPAPAPRTSRGSLKGAAMPRMNMVEAIRSGLRQEMERDETVLLMGEDVGHLGGVFRVTDGLQQFFGAQRVIDTPLAESVIAGSALGLAVAGWRPVVEIQFLGFAQQCFHQIDQQISRIRFRTRGCHTAPMVIRSPFGGNVRTPEFHSDSMEQTFAQSSGLKVVMPANPYDAKGLLAEAIRDPRPGVVSRTAARLPPADRRGPERGLHGAVRRAQGRPARAGDVTVVAWSQAVPVAEKAAEIVAEKGISAHVVDLRTLVPLDEAGLVAAVERTGRCVVVHESQATAGFGAEVIALLQEQAFYSLEAPVRRVAAPDAPYPMPGIEDHFVPDAGRVAAAIEETAAER